MFSSKSNTLYMAYEMFTKTLEWGKGKKGEKRRRKEIHDHEISKSNYTYVV